MEIDCTYKINGNKIIVSDFTGTDIEWNIINNNSISRRNILKGKLIIYNKVF